MSVYTDLGELAVACRQFPAVIKHIDGQPRLHLTLSVTPEGVETVEVRSADAAHPHFWAVTGVYLDHQGSVQETLLAVVYGLALLPALIGTYAAIRKEQTTA